MLKPLRVNLESASVPPASTLSSMPCLMSLAPNMMAFADDEQAVLMVLTISRKPRRTAIFSVLSLQSCVRTKLLNGFPRW